MFVYDEFNEKILGVFKIVINIINCQKNILVVVYELKMMLYEMNEYVDIGIECSCELLFGIIEILDVLVQNWVILIDLYE